MPRRRDFLTTGSLTALGTLSMPRRGVAGAAEKSETFEEFSAAVRKSAGARSADALAADEGFWARVRQAYALDPSVVNLDHGWTNPAPREAVEAMVREARTLESLPAEHLPRLWEEISDKPVRAALAGALGVPPVEIALVRNATEALNTVLLGVPLRAGDEIVCSAHDYYAMLDAIEQRQARDGIVVRMVRPPLPAPSFESLASTYEAAIGPRTRLVLLTHPSNLTGQLLPVRAIAEAAHRVGAEVVVDGAQSLGLVEDPVASLDVDYYGASLHKWLGAPVGLGVLWMRPAHAAKVWPLVAPPPAVTGMARFEWIGTAPAFTDPGALPALALHEAIGATRKAARLRHLASVGRALIAKALPEARFYTTADPGMALGLLTVEVPGRDPGALQKRIRSHDGILVQAMADAPGERSRHPEIRGVRVSPNVYSTPAEVERFAKALAAAARA